MAAVSVGVTATKIGEAPVGATVVIQNSGAASVFIGPSTVTTATGIPVAAGATYRYSPANFEGRSIYGIVASGTADVRTQVEGRA